MTQNINDGETVKENVLKQITCKHLSNLVSSISQTFYVKKIEKTIQLKCNKIKNVLQYNKPSNKPDEYWIIK